MTTDPRSTERIVQILASVNGDAVATDAGRAGAYLQATCHEAARRLRDLTLAPTAILRAMEFASIAHGDQKRKYTGEPYIVHPMEVARLLIEADQPLPVVIAGILHDTIEDTPVTYEVIQNQFGGEVAHLVWSVTDQTKPTDGNREHRKTIDRMKIATGGAATHTIKAADLIDNTRTIAFYDPNFAKVYLPEKRKLLAVMQWAHPELLSRAWASVEAAESMLLIREAAE